MERVFRNKYYDDILKITDILSDEYDKVEELANNENDDIYLQKCRKRYKNLHKQVSVGASERVQDRFEIFKEQYPIYQERYKDGLITGEELMEWLECMKVRK